MARRPARSISVALASTESYDPLAPEFLRSKLGIEAMDGAFKVVDAGRQSRVKIAEEGIVLEARAKPNADDEGVDLAIAEAFKSMRETASAPAEDGEDGAAQMNYGVSGTVAGATFTGLRANEIGALWRSLVAHIDADERPPEIRERLLAALPFWSQLRAHAEIGDVGVETPQGGARMKTLQESLDLTGLTRKGAAEIALAIEDMTLKSDLLPIWSGELWPASLSLDVSAAGEGWDKAARLAIDDPNFLVDGELSPNTQDKIAEVLTSGDPKLVLKPGHLKIPTLDLALRGRGPYRGGPASRASQNLRRQLGQNDRAPAGAGEERRQSHARDPRGDPPQGPRDNRRRGKARLGYRGDRRRRRHGQRRVASERPMKS